MSVSAAESPVEAAGAAFRALRRGLARSRGFSLHPCTCDWPAAREEWIANLAASLPHVTVHSVTLGETDDDVLDTVSSAVCNQQDQLPVYERLGDQRSLLVGRANVALLLAERGRAEDRCTVLALLAWSLAAARRMGLPEAGRIEHMLASMGVAPGQLPAALAELGIDPKNPLDEHA